VPCGSRQERASTPTKPLQIDKTPGYQRAQALEHWPFMQLSQMCQGQGGTMSTVTCVYPGIAGQALDICAVIGPGRLRHMLNDRALTAFNWALATFYRALAAF
jgi:hypothetical protein